LKVETNKKKLNYFQIYMFDNKLFKVIFEAFAELCRANAPSIIKTKVRHSIP